ncbi:aldo/keto reductase [Gillisia sp. Q332]|uniref:aldo/keto reductase n=1 Tax=Gillisia xinjiangensis TaxID=3384765 RepID=UPI00391C7AF9
MKANTLESERLVLRPLTSAHLSERYVNWMNDPAVYKYLESGGNYSIEQLKDYLEEQEKKDILFWAIHLKGSNMHIGNIKIDPVDKIQKSGEYGIMIGAKNEWGKGYAREASLRVINYCFQELGFTKISLGVIEKNIDALELYKKMGFRIERTIENAGVYQGETCNSVRMVLVNKDSNLKKIILGTVQMGLPYGISNSSGKISLENSIKILEYAFESGIEILDSAEAYGDAHHVIGAFHKKHPTENFKIITKLPHQTDVNIDEKVDGYLNDLKVDQLHALLFHSFSSYKVNIDNFDVLRKLKSDKKVKYLGVSVYTNEEIEEVILNDEIDIIQLPFNLFDNNRLRGEILKRAKAKGKIIHTRSALLQGLFFKDINDQKEIVQKLKDELILLSDISKKDNASISELALSYCLSQNIIDNVLIGIDSIKQLKDNIKSVNYKIRPGTIDKINSIKIKNKDLLNPSLWK